MYDHDQDPLASNPAGDASYDDEHLYASLCSRDRRFDGRFFVGVTSTGIYCRPVCPARTPRRRNVRFFSCAAAAEDAGFRACRRCRPETAPGSPAWNGSSATVARAVRLIDDGIADRDGLGALADRLGVTDRHLRRLFLEHLGTSPIRVASTRRAHLARRLIDETDLSFTKIALAAGYRSLRNFNQAMQESFGCAPSRLRLNTRAKLGTETLRLRIAYREPFEWTGLHEFFAYRAIAGVESCAGDVYRRTVLLGGQPCVVSVGLAATAGHLEVGIPSSAASSIGDVLSRVRRMFDVTADADRIAQSLGRDPILKGRVEQRPGLRVPGCWDVFEVLVRAIVGQQVSVAGARTILGRIVERCGERVDPDPDLTHLFPTPAAVAGADLDGIGMPGARIRALQGVSSALAEGRLVLSDDSHETTRRLCEFAGIGPWTAQYVALRGLGDPDVFQPGDLGVRRAMTKADGTLPSPGEVEALAEAWRPWRSYAQIYLWTTPASR